MTWARDVDILGESFATFECPTPGNAKPGRLYDLVAVTTGTVLLDTPLRSIPFQKYASRIITVANGAVCTGPYHPKLRITATCEMESEVYQYGVVLNTTTNLATISYDPAHRLYASNDTKEIYLDFTPVVTGGGGGQQGQSVGGGTPSERKSDTFAMIVAVFSIVVAFFTFVCYKLIKIYHKLVKVYDDVHNTLQTLKPPEKGDDAAVHKVEVVAKAPATHDISTAGLKMENIYVQSPHSDMEMHAKPTNDAKV